MNRNTTIGIDLAKKIMHIVHLNNGKKVAQLKLLRPDFLPYFAELAKNAELPTLAMEACSGSNYWTQQLQKLGFSVKLLKPKDVKAYASARQKNDINDALAIAKAANDPELMNVRSKSKSEQDISFFHKNRANTIGYRVQLTNTLMAVLSEYGYVTKLSKSRFCRLCEEEVQTAFEEGCLNAKVKEILLKECLEIKALCEKEKAIDKYLSELNKTCKKAIKLQKIIGIGPINASNLSIAPMEIYPSPRDFSASLGLVPKQQTSGDRVVLGSITKQGDRYSRTMLIQGARSIAIHAKRGKMSQDPLVSWAQKKFSENKPFNLVCVGLANKLARIAYAIVMHDRDYGVQNLA